MFTWKGYRLTQGILAVVAFVRSYELSYRMCVETVSVAAEIIIGHLINKRQASYRMSQLAP